MTGSCLLPQIAEAAILVLFPLTNAERAFPAGAALN